MTNKFDNYKRDKKSMRTKRAHAKFADRGEIGGHKVAVIESRKKTDFLTIEEFAEELYQKPVKNVYVEFMNEDL